MSAILHETLLPATAEQNQNSFIIFYFYFYFFMCRQPDPSSTSMGDMSRKLKESRRGENLTKQFVIVSNGVQMGAISYSPWTEGRYHPHDITINYRIYSNAKQGFSLKFGAKICEVVLKSHMKCRTRPWQTRSIWTRPCKVKPRPAPPNHVRSKLSWDII